MRIFEKIDLSLALTLFLPLALVNVPAYAQNAKTIPPPLTFSAKSSESYSPTQMLNVSIVSLLANPASYDDKLVRVSEFLHNKFEDHYTPRGHNLRISNNDGLYQ